ncbi:unnamed protein product [Chrysoparadoxa australica]
MDQEASLEDTQMARTFTIFKGDAVARSLATRERAYCPHAALVNVFPPCSSNENAPFLCHTALAFPTLSLSMPSLTFYLLFPFSPALLPSSLALHPRRSKSTNGSRSRALSQLRKRPLSKVRPTTVGQLPAPTMPPPVVKSLTARDH